MAGFNWDDYPAASLAPATTPAPTPAGAFNWADHPAAASQPPSTLEAASRGALQGATMGFGDEVTGGGEALYDKVLGDSMGKSLSQLYSQHTDEARQANAAAQKAHPWAYGGGNLAGGIASGALTGGIGAESALGRVGVAAAQGAVSGVGFGNADSVTDGAAEAAKGALIGGAVGGVVEGAKGVYNTLTGNLAPALAEKATGATGAFAKKNFLPDYGTGKELLKRKMLSLGDGPADIAAKADAALDQSWKGITDSTNALSENGATVDRNTVLDFIQKKIDSMKGDDSQLGLVDQLKTRMKGIESQLPGDATEVGAENAAEDIGSNIPLNQGEEIKRGYMGKSNYLNPEANQADKIVAQGYRQAVEDSAVEADPGLASQFKKDKETYGLLSPVSVAAGSRASTLNQSQFGGFLDQAADFAAGGGVKGVVGAAARREIAPRIASVVAVGADKLAEVLRKAPESLGPFRQQLTDAMNRGGVSLAATNSILNQTSEAYREHMKTVFGDGQ